MQEMGHRVGDSLPSFAKNLHISVVDHEPLFLKHVTSLLEQHSCNGKEHHNIFINLVIIILIF